MKHGGGELKRAYIQVPYAVLSRLLFGQKIGIYRVGDDAPGPNGYVEFIVYGEEESAIERGSLYQLHLNRTLREIDIESSDYQPRKERK